MVLRRVVLVALAGLVLVQLLPYGHAHENPPVRAEPGWDSPRTRELFFRVCKDCHSNQTEWPWYSGIAPVSWLVQRDVEEGRSHFNVSEWGRRKQHADEAAGNLRRGDMPPWFYRPLHPQAWLSEGDRAALLAGLVATFGDDDDEEDSGRGHHRRRRRGHGGHDDSDA